ncbi:LamG-like jellyroll fold domain-containing protein [Candidatus Omnitrophota bacterium]
MSRSTIFIVCVVLLLFMLNNVQAETNNPVSYHISFDDLSVLDECYVARSGLKTPEERKLEIVPGKFGSALYLGAVPLVYEGDNLSGLDLDLVTAVIYNVAMAQLKGTGYDEPFIWGAGKLHPAYGGLAFWVKGPLRADMLFNQSASSFGRLEKELLQVRLEEDGSISAYIEDTRYVQHTIRTDPIWKENVWMHIALMWDCSSGLSIWVNGKEEASSIGADAWWDNQRPSLFHFPMSQASYDECYLFDRPLTPKEIETLYRNNIPPEKGTQAAPFDEEAVDRLKKAFFIDSSTLPRCTPSDGGALVFREITPERIDDEGVSGWWLSDGRYECAWPHEYSLFTIVPGDADFHAEKADILPPAGADVNYITFEGNLDYVIVLKGSRNGRFDTTPIITVPQSDGYFLGTVIDTIGNADIRIPFTQSYGTPPGFTGYDVQLPLSGDLRIHEVGLFNVSHDDMPILPGDRTLYINPMPPDINDARYSASIKTLLPSYDRKLAGLYTNSGQKNEKILTSSPMTSLNLLSEPVTGKTAYDTILLDMWLSTQADDAVLMVKLLNPAVPSQVWTHAEMSIKSFSGRPKRFRLALSFDPLFFVNGDRLWLQIKSTDGLSIVNGDSERPATVTLRPVGDEIRAELPYSLKTMQPLVMTYSKMFEYMPWRITQRFPDIDSPENFNGPFDMVYPWQAVLKVNPMNSLANIYRELVTNGHNKNRFPAAETQYSSQNFNAPENAPDWAAYFRKFRSFRDRIITWWRLHQRSDGQAGGGWNDDTLLFASDHGREGGYSDMILDSKPDTRILYNNIFDGFDRTNLFKGGYCRITPMDRLHNGDFIRERYKSLIYNLGDPRSAVWALEEAWHWEKPDKTPVNYGDGSAFLFGKNVLEWYWNKQRVNEPYELEDRDGLIKKLREAAGACNDTTFWRFTGARVHTDDQSPYGSDIMHTMLNGGFGIRDKGGGVYYTHVKITLGVGWIQGGDADCARLVEYSGNDGLRIQMYSFDSFDREVIARLYRMDTGRYSVTMRSDGDGDGRFETTVFDHEENLRRFGRLTFTIPPKIPIVLEVRQIEKEPESGSLPDLAISSYYVKKEDKSLVVTVHNIGSSPSGKFTVSALTSDGTVVKTVKVESIDAPLDFVPRFVDVRLSGLTAGNSYRIVIDREDAVREIFEENNAVDCCFDE